MWLGHFGANGQMVVLEVVAAVTLELVAADMIYPMCVYFLVLLFAISLFIK